MCIRDSIYTCCLETTTRRKTYITSWLHKRLLTFKHRSNLEKCMGPERKLYQKLRKSLPQISWIRLENNSLHGTPDLLGYNNSGHFFTVELKVTKGNKIKFSPHQIAFHVKHPRNSFILVEHLGQRSVKLFPGSGIIALESFGLTLEPLCLTLDACCSFFQELGA